MNRVCDSELRQFVPDIGKKSDIPAADGIWLIDKMPMTDRGSAVVGWMVFFRNHTFGTIQLPPRDSMGWR